MKSAVSNQKKLFSSIIYLCHSYMAVLFAIVQGMILVPLYLKQIPTEIYGYWLASGNIIGYFALFDLGLPSIFIQKAASFYGNAKEKGNLGILCGTCFIYGLVVALFVFVIGFIFVLTINMWINIDHNQISAFKHSVFLSVISSTITIFTQFIGSFLLGLHESLCLSVTSILAFIFAILSTLLALSLKLGVMAIAIGFLVRSLVYFIGTTGSFIFIWKKITNEQIHFSFTDIKNMFRLSTISIVGKSSSVISNHSDALLNSTILNPAIAAVYSFNSKIKDIIFSIPDRISSATIPTIADMQSNSNISEKKKYPIIILIFSIELSFICSFGLFIFNKSIIELWIGKEMFGGQLLTTAFCIVLIMNVFRNTISNLVFSTGEIKTVNYCSMFETCLKIPIAIAFMKLMGVIGLPIASIIIILFMSGPYLTSKFVNIFNILKVDIINIFREISIFCLSLFIISFIVFKFELINSWKNLFILLSSYLFISFASIIFLNSFIRQILIKKLFNFKWFFNSQ